MKYANSGLLEIRRPSVTAEKAILFCLEQFRADGTKQLDDQVVSGRTLEEVFGALSLAMDRIAELSTEE